MGSAVEGNNRKFELEESSQVIRRDTAGMTDAPEKAGWSQLTSAEIGRKSRRRKAELSSAESHRKLKEERGLVAGSITATPFCEALEKRVLVEIPEGLRQRRACRFRRSIRRGGMRQEASR